MVSTSQKDERFICTAYHKTFTATKGTAFDRLRTATATVTLVVTVLAHSGPPQAIVAAFGFDDRTVVRWMARGGGHGQAVQEELVAQPRELGQVPADESGVRKRVCNREPAKRRSWLHSLAGRYGLSMSMSVQGALNLFAGFDTRTGKVYATTAERKRQVECITFLEHLEREIPPTITTMHVVLDNVQMHKGKQVQAWLTKHPRFVFHFPPVHCSWMNQVEQWFSILQRKRLRIADFADKPHLAQRLMAFVAEGNEHAHPLQWSTKSVAKVMAKCESTLAIAA